MISGDALGVEMSAAAGEELRANGRAEFQRPLFVSIDRAMRTER